LALAVPLSRITPRVGGGSAFFVRPHRAFGFLLSRFRCGAIVGSPIAMSKISAVRLVSARAWLSGEQVLGFWIYERFDSPDFI
jgi:hypothetical protein